MDNIEEKITRGETVFARFEVIGKFATLNEILAKKGTSNFAYNSMKKKYENAARLQYRKQVKNQGIKKPIDYKIRFQFLWYVTTRGKDADNVDAARKFFIDALDDENIILKDNLTIYTESEALFAIDKKNPRVIIFLLKPKYDLI
jgi:Holliday junction resolvase RusA-like endonuclease